MKRFMNGILFAIVVFSLLWVAIANAGGGAYYDPDRNGEGIFVVTQDNQLAFGMFTFAEKNSVIEPTVSPQVPYRFTSCPEPEKFICGQMWYVGSGMTIDGITMGDLYMNQPINYPFADLEGMLSDQVAVGVFFLQEMGDGYSLAVDCSNSPIPMDSPICVLDYEFDTKIIGE